jgi:hypothetical protein
MSGENRAVFNCTTEHVTLRRRESARSCSSGKRGGSALRSTRTGRCRPGSSASEARVSPALAAHVARARWQYLRSILTRQMLAPLSSVCFSFVTLRLSPRPSYSVTSSSTMSARSDLSANPRWSFHTTTEERSWLSCSALRTAAEYAPESKLMAVQVLQRHIARPCEALALARSHCLCLCCHAQTTHEG